MSATGKSNWVHGFDHCTEVVHFLENHVIRGFIINWKSANVLNGVYIMIQFLAVNNLTVVHNYYCSARNNCRYKTLLFILFLVILLKVQYYQCDPFEDTTGTGCLLELIMELQALCTGL